MTRLQPWQWIILALPITGIIGFILIAAGQQIHEWGINWIWAIFTLIFLAWRWLLVKWTQPARQQIEAIIADINQEIETTPNNTNTQPQTALEEIILKSQNDPPIWEDLQTFWQRCQELVTAIAHIYHPEVKYPLLSIYIPQAYSLIRGTIDDMDRWMQKLSPALNQITVGQAYESYKIYRKLEPSARKLLQVWNWAQWLLNPASAAARIATKGANNKATEQLLGNLNQMLREAALKNLCRQAVALYSGGTLPLEFTTTQPALPKAETQTLKDILSQAEPITEVEQKPLNIMLVGRTGAGKSSLINSLFQADKAEVDILPSTDKIKNYHWTQNDQTLTLTDTPGYEQVKRDDLRETVLEYATNADLLLLVTPALDPALQMDVDFLKEIYTDVEDLPAIAIVTQVDRLRPIREWEPPYDWEWGNRPKEISIREATEYRTKTFGELCEFVLPVVTSDIKINRTSWGIDALSLALLDAIEPVKKLRLARFLRNLEVRTVAAAKIIDNYTFQMATTQGLTALLKSPVLQFISTLTTGSPTLANLLATQIPVEQLPVVIGKLQMAYELYSLLNNGDEKMPNFDLLTLWPLLLENQATPERNAWAFGHALIEFWTQNLTVQQLRERFESYLQQQ
ncbi:GTPase family protein [Ancylothrix sp. C2]|uniref:GTPase family protein n=1 Tax=Ancylothrix sp. D3o TaxID=2953691 RepID=UPI0021BBA289|nr:GTPase family protein [Ancylothrix sp. D3o]MCT7951640.1 GTPase family protein [Ancylothrix sp. D3o]